MDTGYTNLITPEQRREVLRTTREVVQGRKFVAGAFIEGETGDVTTLYKRAVAEIVEHGGTPILFQSSALKSLDNKAKVNVYREVANECEAMLAFELGEMFAPFGQIYDLDTMRELMQIPQLKGAKHSSLNRELEWQRLALRDEVRPDFKVYTGNDLAIDMVCYGSDYLLGLSAFSPEAFALRDRLWQADDSRFYGLNDLLQYLGFFAFRPPVPAYKHNAAQFLALRGRIQSNTPHPKAASRPESDIEVLQDISRRLDEMLDGMSEPLPELASQEAML
jgi:dihydrodipicolinate synthase/N-acetylneuraminate lyase